MSPVRFRSLLAASLIIVLASIAHGRDEARTVRVASISFEPVKFDLPGNAETLESWFRKAARGGARIAVAPEGALEGYVVDGIIAEEVKATRMHDVALSIDSPTIKRFQGLAQELEMCLVFGFAEKIEEDVFNCALFIDDEGHICGKYHKMQFAEGYHDSWWFNRLGRQSRTFETPFGRCGVLICNDRWNPRLARIPALDGAQFLVIPSFGSTSTKQDDAVLARGVENALPIIEANVGVSLIVNDNEIVGLDRRRAGVTFAEISIPPKKTVDSVARDEEEAAFLKWRDAEMPVRLAQRMARLVQGLSREKREYLLYLPLYNGVTSVELGVPGAASVWQKRLSKDAKPIVFWGTSITQGGCASRPGMVHTAILGRRLERPIINLGFSGNGKMEPELAELIREIDAAVYVIDCLPNLTADLVAQRVRPVVEALRTQRLDTPILLVEDRTYGSAFLVDSLRRANETRRAALRAAYDAMQAEGVSELYYLAGDGLLGGDGEDTVDGSHPTDLGFLRQANAFEAALRPILEDAEH